LPKPSKRVDSAIASIYGAASKFLDDDVMKNLSEVFVKMDPFAKIVERMAKAEVEKAMALGAKKVERAMALEAKKTADALKKVEKAMKLVAKNKLETARRLIKEGINLELIANAMDLSLETVQGLQV